MLYLDCETFPFGPGLQAPPLVSVCLAVGDRHPELLLASDAATAPRVAAALHAAHTVVGHNVAYDLACIVEYWPHLWPEVTRLYAERRVADTQLAARLRDIASTGRLRRSYSLGALAQDLLGAELDKGEDGWRLRYGELAGTPVQHWPDRAKAYALDDVRATREVWLELTAKGEPATLREQAQAGWALHLTSARGIRADAYRVAALDAALSQEMAASGAQAQAAGLMRADGTVDRAAACKAAGTPTLTREDMEASGVPELQALARFKAAQKTESTYLPWLREACVQPVHPRYQVLVESGRTSSFSPNVQQLPRSGGVREALRPRDGYCLIVADYAVAELVCLAQVLLHQYGTSEMAAALRRGDDLHLTTASRVAGLTYAETVARYRAGDPKVKKYRQLAKGVNFGAPGGLGKATLAGMLGVGLPEAGDLLAAWVDTYPELKLHFRDLGASARGGSYTLRHPLTGYVRAGLDYCSAANHYFQHLCSMGAKAALFEVVQACNMGTRGMAGAHPWAFIHDEIVLECPIDARRGVADALTLIMQEQFARYCPDVPVKAEAVATMRWCKDAERVVEADGGLGVWGGGEYHA